MNYNPIDFPNIIDLPNIIDYPNFIIDIENNNDDDKEIEDESFYDDMPPLIHIDPKDYNFEIFYDDVYVSNEKRKINNSNNSSDNSNNSNTNEPPAKKRCMSEPTINNNYDDDNISYDDLILSSNIDMFDGIEYYLTKEHCLNILREICKNCNNNGTVCPINNCNCKL